MQPTLAGKEEDSSAVADMKSIMATDLKETHTTQQEALNLSASLNPMVKQLHGCQMSKELQCMQILTEETTACCKQPIKKKFTESNEHQEVTPPEVSVAPLGSNSQA